MFKFLKDKLKGVISKISRKAEEEVHAGEPIKEEAAIQKEKQEYSGAKKEVKEESWHKSESKLKEETKEAETKIKKEPIIEEAQKFKIDKKAEEEPIVEVFPTKPAKEIKKEFEEPLKEPKQKSAEIIESHQKIEEREQKIEEPEKKGFFARLTEKIATTKISEEKFEDLFSDLEMVLMENNVAMEVIGKIKSDLKQNLVNSLIKRMGVGQAIKDSLRSSIISLFDADEITFVGRIEQKKEKPFVIAFFGINGSGKTTTIAKIASILKGKKISCVLAASDTFRAASIEQLQHHADKIGIKLIKHGYGSDPAAVSFDAIKHAKAKNIDVVLIDTAGRLHSNANLMDELKKVVKVAKPDLKIFVGESIAGNDCIEQAQRFNESVGIDGIILTKADVDEKGGASISVSYVTKKPIIYLGVGQEYDDLKEFEPSMVVEGLGL